MADRYRRDLKAAGIGDGCHAFDLAVRLTAVWQHTIEVCRADEGAVLPGSPVVLPSLADGIRDDLLDNAAA